MHDKGRALHDFKRHPKPTGSTKTYPRGFPLQEEEEDEDEEDEEEGGGGTNLPQETDKLQTYKVPAPKTASGRKRKGRSGKRRDCDKRKPRLPRLRSLGLPGRERGPCPERGPHGRPRGAPR
ncbi:hypothetical protein Z043_126309 [Scleropages formosus]|uniref:Uncharacterized protein n=1 Tax=Scleropages formosus TaxID=113540 RepID=A0A0P7T5C5_SCLFO|nr:hypothetical protein Z043_126309 [Scleropages formosus]